MNQQELAANPARDHWRSAMVNNTARELGHTVTSFEPVLIQNQLLTQSMSLLLDELTEQEHREGRTHGMELGCRRRCFEIARAFKHHATSAAPRWLHEELPQHDLANQF